jgi:hypothetical protein
MMVQEQEAVVTLSQSTCRNTTGITSCDHQSKPMLHLSIMLPIDALPLVVGQRCRMVVTCALCDGADE